MYSKPDDDTGLRPWWRSPRVLVAVLVLAGLALRLALAARSLTVVDRLFIPDDSYYTLAIARSLAAGLGPSVDGVHLTSGFQPLLAFLLVPVFALSDDPDVGLRAALVLLSFVDAGSAVLLGRIACRLGGQLAAVLAVAMWALSPVAISNALNGLETSLAVFCQLAAVELWARARARGSTRSFVGAGALCGLAVLARVDSVLLVAALGLFQLFRRSWRATLVASSAAAVVVAPWWVYCTLRFGSPIPESGAAVLQVVEFHLLSVPQKLGWAAGALLGTPFAELGWLQDRLFGDHVLAVVAWLVVAGALGAGIAYGLTRRSQGEPLAVLGLHGLGVLCLYSFVVSALWFFRRYLAPAQAVLTLILAIAAGAVWGRNAGRRVVAASGAGLVALGVVLGARTSVGYLFARPATSPDVGYHGAKGYRQAAREVLAVAPDRAVIGSLQSGALSYYAPEGIRIVNLDGVVDAEAAEAVEDMRLAAFARRRGVTHLADWRLNVSHFLRLSGEPQLTQARLRTVAVARPEGGDRFILLEIRWPPRVTPRRPGHYSVLNQPTTSATTWVEPPAL